MTRDLKDVLPALPPVPAWWPQAACRGMGAAMFHPPPVRGRNPKKDPRINAAKAVCGRCDVRLACLADAMALAARTDQLSGAIRGGLTAFERGKAEARRRARLRGVV